jgi:FAD/FMN-containing dehydrogenase
MRRVKDFDIVSGTITVQSGITMKDLHQLLDERSFTTGLPTRPWRQESLGSVLAAALDAHWGPRYGFMEEHVVGLGVVFPDGTPTWTRTAPRKAVGPDFDRIFLGSRGRYGIVYEATLRIYPSASRAVLSYGAATLTEALEATRAAFEDGLDPRAVEILTPADDRSWGRKRVGLTDGHPVLVLVEPWQLASGRRVDDADRLFAQTLKPLDPPAGWDIHDGLLPAPRAWAAPVVGVPWAELAELAQTLGAGAPPGLWIVRMSRHGGWLSLASGVTGPAADVVRPLIERHRPPVAGPWQQIQETLKQRLDPRAILNPCATP